MTVRLSAAVMVHPSRLAAAEALRDRHPELDLRLVVDPAPDGPPSAARTAQHAWAAVEPWATHHLVLQDDAVLVPGFLARALAAIAARPADAISFFTEWGSDTSYAVRLAALAGEGWAEVVDHYVPSVALALPADVARAFAAEQLKVSQDDVALHGFLRDAGIQAVVPVPNLVDHDPGPSLVGNDRMGPRRSACFLADSPSLSPSLTRPLFVPVLSTLDGLNPRCLVRAQAGDDWQRTTLHPLLAGHDIDADAVMERCRAEIAGLNALPPFGLAGLWFTGYALGVAASCADIDDVALAALHTMPHGAYRGAFGPIAEPSLRTLTELIRAGVAAGADSADRSEGIAC